MPLGKGIKILIGMFVDTLNESKNSCVMQAANTQIG